MKKYDNSWEINFRGDIREEFEPHLCNVQINNTDYVCEQNFAALTHAILLLVDAINDKSLGSIS